MNPLAHPICLAWPERLTASRAWHEHIPFAMLLVDLVRPRTLVELGVHGGDSYCAFCQAVKSLDLDTRCYGVDTWQGDPHAGFYGPGLLAELRAHHDPLYRTFSTLVQGTFDDARGRFADGSIDVLHIDGYHAYEAVKHDFESWLPKMSAEGVVLLHDTRVEEHDFGVGQLWDEIQHRYPSFEFHHGHGLGVLAVGRVRSPELGTLFDADPGRAAAIRDLFFQLGQRLSLHDDVHALRRQLEAATDRPDARSGPRAPAPNPLQVFWQVVDGFSEDQSVTTPLVADGQVHECVLPLPSHARGLLRLDPGNRPGYVEIYRLELVAEAGAGAAPARETLRRWGAAEGEVIPLSGLVRLSGGATSRFICTDGDPQLALDGMPERRDDRPWSLRVTLRASERAVEILTEEIDHLERTRAHIEQRLVESQTALTAAQARAVTQEETARALAARLAEHEQIARARSTELAQAHERIAALEARAAEHETASAAWQAEKARRKDQALAHEAAIHSLRTEQAQQGAELAESDRRLRAREYELYRITASRGWRLLNGHRRVKQRVLRSLRPLVTTWRRLFGHTYRPLLEPIDEVRWLHDRGVWEATGRDPQFNLVGPWPREWAEVAVDIEVERPVVGHARLYVDRGAGYSERESCDLGEVGGPQTRLVRLGPEVIGLRLDPFESAGRFRVRVLELRSVSARRARPRADAAAASAHAAPDSPAAFAPPPAVDPYEAWLEVNRWNGRRAALLAERLSALREPPLLSVVMPVYEPSPALLDRAIASVVGQVYERWELCIADDASPDPTVRDALARWAAREPRIRVICRDARGHISRATNSAAEAARGEFLAFLDQDDELTPDALGEIVLHLAEHPDTDVVYSDDDKINAQGDRFAPQFKPDWSPELLLSYMYWSHLVVVRRRVFVEAGALRAGYEGAQDYDLALRLAELTDRIGHVPRVLYHWRVGPGSTAQAGDAKPESFRAGARAVQDALDRRGVRARARHPDWAARARCGIFSHEFPDDGPRVAIIIPTRNNLALLKACLESLEKTTYTNYDVVIADNGDDDAHTLDAVRERRCRVVRVPRPAAGFSFAAVNNRAVEEVDADLVLFLNDDTEVIAPRWLSQMVGYLGLPGVGAVGARLVFPDGRLQHAGIVHGYYHGLAGPAFKLLPASAHGYLSHAMIARNYSAVTAACLLTPRALFRRLGGFDGRRFAVAYSDVDYCYRLRAAGRRVVYCPTAELIHHEGASRGFADNPAEPAAFRRIHGTGRDPFYNPNLSLAHERFAVDARALAPARLAPIRALMCGFNLNREGAPYSQLELTTRLKETGVIDPLVYSPQDGPLRAAYEARGIPVEVFDHPLARARTSSAYADAVARFAAWIEAVHVDVIYGNTRHTFYAIDAAKRLGLPSIWNPRESEPWQTYFEQFGAELVPHALRCFAHPYRVIFVSDATRESCAALDTRHNFITIHTGLDLGRFAATLERWPRDRARRELALAPDDVMWLSLGTICERKSQLDLVEAVARLDERTAHRIRVFMVGDRPGGYSDLVRAAWAALPASRRSRIHIVAETSETGLYYAASDAFVHTSRVESFPRVILEAMAAGLAIVTTPVHGIAEQVRENVNALCYGPGDGAALAEQIARLVREPELRATLARNSGQVLGRLNDFDAMAAAYAEVFREAWLTGTPR